MGRFSVKVAICNPSEPSRSVDAELFVDTGATLSWVPRELVEKVGAPRRRRRSFLLADGRTIERDTAAALLRLDGSEADINVVLAEPGDAHLLGATALESLGFAVDPINKRLVPQTLLAM